MKETKGFLLEIEGWLMIIGWIKFGGLMIGQMYFNTF